MTVSFSCVAFTALTLSDKETQYGSVVRVLGQDEALCRSNAYAHALILRAAARSDARQLESALADAQAALQVLTKGEANEKDLDLLAKAYRIQSDVYEGLGRLVKAMESLRQWGLADPSFGTKTAKEMQRLRQKLV